jgi:hypothetical protein
MRIPHERSDMRDEEKINPGHHFIHLGYARYACVISPFPPAGLDGVQVTNLRNRPCVVLQATKSLGSRLVGQYLLRFGSGRNDG